MRNDSSFGLPFSSTSKAPGLGDRLTLQAETIQQAVQATMLLEATSTACRGKISPSYKDRQASCHYSKKLGSVPLTL